MAEQSVTLNPGESRVVSFEAVPHEAKTYHVSVNGLTGSFIATMLVGWVSPTGHNDPNNKWVNEERAYDGNLDTFSSTTGLHYYGEPLELTLDSPVYCDKVRICAASFWTHYYRDPDLSVDVYYDGAYHNIWSGRIPKQTWVELPIPAGIKLVSKARIKWNEDVPKYLYEFDFWSEAM